MRFGEAIISFFYRKKQGSCQVTTSGVSGLRAVAAVQGLGVSMKGHAALWIVGLLFICGMPPSILFLSELGLVCTAPVWVSAAVLVLLFIVFAAMMKVALAMTMGRPANAPAPLPRRLAAVPTLLAAALAAGGLALIVLLAVAVETALPAATALLHP